MSPLLGRRGLLVLDGGLATELERRGHDLDHPLWSAELLRTEPAVIGAVHRDYLAAGADCVTAATYQASLPGLAAEGVDARESRELLLVAVRLAREARDELARADRPPPLVAASVGPYGAYLADGSEYSGEYGVSKRTLRDFHERRLEILVEGEPDLLACETIPSFLEAEVLAELLRRLAYPSWVSFSCRDGGHVSDGTPIERCAELFADCPTVLASGVNCVAPSLVRALTARLRRASLPQAIVVYPGSGERYVPSRRCWTGRSEPESFTKLAREWAEEGASLIGGCCRTTPEHVRAIRDAFPSSPGTGQ